MDISVIIVNWNTRDLLQKCIQSIYDKARGVTFEFFVIDNNSNDHSVTMVRESFPKIHLIGNKENRGFAAANNQGIKQATGDYILLLNPDTELVEDSLTTMVQFMKSHPDCGISGCHLLNTDRSHQDSVRSFPGTLDQGLMLLKLHHLFPHLPFFKRYLNTSFDYTKPQPVDQVMGAFFLIKKEVLKKIGLLDEGFFNWFEEVDFCKRTLHAGYTIWYTPETKIIHHFGQSFGQLMAVPKQIMWNRSLRYYFLKHHSLTAYAIIGVLSWISVGLAWGFGLVSKKKSSG